MQVDETMPILDFDDIDDWAPRLTAVLRPWVSDFVKQELLTARLEYIEDALNLLLRLTDSSSIINTTLNWLSSMKIMGYHGSRLTVIEVESVKAVGLLPLEADRRHVRLERALSRHPSWPDVAGQLHTAIQQYGPRAHAGHREGQVHLTLSRSGLVKGFPHYLTYGSEFDQQVAQRLLGSKGLELLAQDGEPSVIQVAIPGESAVAAAHPFFEVRDLIDRGDVPNLVNEFLMAWSYRLANPGFQSHSLKVDCGMLFRSAIPPMWIVRVESLLGRRTKAR